MVAWYSVVMETLWNTEEWGHWYEDPRNFEFLERWLREEEHLSTTAAALVTDAARCLGDQSAVWAMCFAWVVDNV